MPICTVDSRTELRLLQTTDADALAALAIRPGRLSTVDGARAWLEIVCKLFVENSALPCGIQVEGRLAGYLILEFGDVAPLIAHIPSWRRICEDLGVTGGRDAQIHYGLTPRLRRQGIVTQSAAALFDHVFRTRDLVLVRATIPIANTASCAVVRRLGFEDRGFLDERGESRNFVMTPERWRVLGPGRRRAESAHGS